MSEDKGTMIKLTHTNWVTWKPRMEDIIYCKDMHEPIEDDSVFHHVSKETDAEELWKKLESLFEKKTAAKKAFLFKEMINMKFNEDKSVAVHLNDFQNMTNQLATMESALSKIHIYELGAGLVVDGAPHELVGLVVPGVGSFNDGVSEGEEVVEDVGVDGVAGRERAGDLGAAALVGEDPEVEFGEEAGEVWEGCGGWGGEGFDPETGADFDWVLLE
ncbi:hypothetical protein ACLB2K_066791 [Fragaria x ananassa]